MREYTDEEWARLVAQVDESNERDGIAWTTDQLRGAVEERRRVRFGTLNSIALLRHVDALLARVAAAEAERDALLGIEACARDLYEAVEMAESVGICLPDRVSTLALGEALDAFAVLAAPVPPAPTPAKETP